MPEALLPEDILSRVVEAHAPWDEFLSIGVDEDFDDLADLDDEIEELRF